MTTRLGLGCYSTLGLGPWCEFVTELFSTETAEATMTRGNWAGPGWSPPGGCSYKMRTVLEQRFPVVPRIVAHAFATNRSAGLSGQTYQVGETGGCLTAACADGSCLACEGEGRWHVRRVAAGAAKEQSGYREEPGSGWYAARRRTARDTKGSELCPGSVKV